MPHVLYVEDDPGHARLAERSLDRAGIRVTVAPSAEEALEVARSSTFDLVITDQKLPGLHGLELLQRLRQQSPGVPVLLVTGGGDEHLAVAALKNGARDYLVKDTDGAYLDLLPMVVNSTLAAERMASEHRAAIEALHRSEAEYRHLFDSVPVGLYRLSPAGEVLDANRACAAILGARSPDVLLGTNLLERYVRDEDRNSRARHLETGEPLVDFEVVMRTWDGGDVWVQENAATSRDPTGEILQFEGSLADISARKRAELELSHLATHDALTNLPNRILLGDRLEQALHVARRTGRAVAVLMLDFDGLKAVNDQHGHAAGDALLRALAARLAKRTRRSDTVARVGGDEFVVVLNQLTAMDDAARVAEELLAVVGEPCRIGDQQLAVTTSIGIALFGEDGELPSELLECADQAMYCAKRNGGNQVVISECAP